MLGFHVLLLKGVDCITTGHAKFKIVCLDTDVPNTALVAIHNAHCNPLPDHIVNMEVYAFCGVSLIVFSSTSVIVHCSDGNGFPFDL